MRTCFAGQETTPCCSSLGEEADQVWAAIPSKGRWQKLPRLPPLGSLVPAFARSCRGGGVPAWASALTSLPLRRVALIPCSSAKSVLVMLFELQKYLCIFLPPDLPLWGSWAAVTAPSGCSWVSSATLGGSGDPCVTATCHRHLTVGGANLQALFVYLK